MDLEEEVERRKGKFYIPNWFSVEIKTGVSGGTLSLLGVREWQVKIGSFLILTQMLTVRLEESDCFSAWVMGSNTNLDTATPTVKRELQLMPTCSILFSLLHSESRSTDAESSL